MSELRDLYQEVILDHSKHPRNRRAMPEASCQAEGINPLCGDKVKVYLLMDQNVVKDVSFEGSGCAISTASVSMMTEMIKGKTKDQILAVFGQFHDLVTGAPLGGGENTDLGKLIIFEGVREFPMRVKCATLAWHAVKAALDHKGTPVSTE